MGRRAHNPLNSQARFGREAKSKNNFYCSLMGIPTSLIYLVAKQFIQGLFEPVLARVILIQ